MSRIGTNTNSNDPHMIKSRVFVGNIDSRLTREELETIFGKYGAISALSLHKGYGFVQYTDELFARAAVIGENNKQYYSKLLDCNVASEPKSIRKRLPQHQAIPTQADNWQSQSYSPNNNPYLAATAHALAVQAQSAAAAAVAAANSAGNSNIGPSNPKRARVLNAADHSSGARKTSNLVSLVSASPSHPPAVNRSVPIVQDKDVKDILICGNCKETFDNYERLISHKALGCRLRYICRCKQMGEPRSLTCIQCGVCVHSSWELVKHHVSDHGASLFVGEERFCTPPTSTDGAGDKGDSVKEVKKASPSSDASQTQSKSNGDKADNLSNSESALELPSAEDVEVKDEDEEEEKSIEEAEKEEDGRREALDDSPGRLIEDIAQESNEAESEPRESAIDDECN